MMAAVSFLPATILYNTRLTKVKFSNCLTKNLTLGDSLPHEEI